VLLHTCLYAHLLQPAEVDTILRWVLAILQQYAATNTWAARLAASRTQEVRVLAGTSFGSLVGMLQHVLSLEASCAYPLFAAQSRACSFGTSAGAIPG
jgi:hypothetical protein